MFCRGVWTPNSFSPGSLTSRMAQKRRNGSLGLWTSRVVCVTGPYTRNQAPAVFQSAHILVHPKYKDPCPTVVVEAMASGLPVVASSSGGLRELLGEKGGSLVESEESWETIHPPDPKRMCDEVLKIDADLDRRSTQARSRAVEHFSERSWLDTQRTLFSQLLGHTSEGP